MADDTVTDTPGARLAFEMYKKELADVPEPIGKILSEYSHIPPEAQNEHIVAVRDKAYASHPYPCLGRWRFLQLDLSSHPLYNDYVVPALAKDSPNKWLYLDLGCCLAQDIRKLLYDGADPSRVYGADLRPEFISAGYQLFQDEATFPQKEHFVAPADVFDFSPESELSKRFDGKIGILHSTAVFHLFTWDEQVSMAKRCLQLMTQHDDRVLICGAQIGNVKPGEYPAMRGQGTRYRHDEESLKKMWHEVVRQETWKDKVKAIEIGTSMTGPAEQDMNRIKEELEAGRKLEAELAKLGEGKEAEARKRHLGHFERGVRWLKWWVWVDFA